MTTEAMSGGERRPNRWRTAVWGTAALLLLLPLVAMQFTREVAWDAADFLIMGVMLTAACGAYELATRMSGNSAYRAAAAIAVVASFLLIWVNLAVGVIGSEDNPLNLLYGGVLAVALLGALLGRFGPAGMARAMTAAAVAQALVAVVAQAAGNFTWVFTAVYVAIWLSSAALFRKAARADASGGAAVPNGGRRP